MNQNRILKMGYLPYLGKKLLMASLGMDLLLGPR